MTMTIERPAAEAPPVQEPKRKRRVARRHAPDPVCGRVTPGDWMDEADCRLEEPELFFDCTSPVMRDKAKAVCAACPVRATCLESAMTEEAARGDQSPDQNRRQRWGIRGGLTAGERWKLAYPGEEDPGEAE